MEGDLGLQAAVAIFTAAVVIYVLWLLLEPLRTAKADERWSLGSLIKLGMYWVILYALYKGWWYLLEVMGA